MKYLMVDIMSILFHYQIPLRIKNNFAKTQFIFLPGKHESLNPRYSRLRHDCRFHRQKVKEEDREDRCTGSYRQDQPLEGR